MNKTIVTVTLGVVLAGGIWWLSSGEGPLPEKFRYSKDSVFKWTPENIRENPELWYRSARRETTDIRKNLANSRFSITQKRIKWANLEANAKAKVRGYTAFLDRAKPEYTEAEASRIWPVSVNGRRFEQPKLQSTIVKVHRDRERERKRERTYNEMTTKAENMALKLTDKLDSLVELDRDLELGQEMADAAKSLVDLNGLSNRGAEIAATAAALQQEIENLFDQDLSYVAPHLPGGVDEADFDAIMNEGTEAQLLHIETVKPFTSVGVLD